MKILLDSNVYISAYVKSDLFHQVSEACLEYLQVHGDMIIMSYLALFEVITVLMRMREKESHIRFFSEIMKAMSNRPPLGLTADMEPSLLLHGFSISLKTSDMIMALTAFEEQAILLTWDKQMIREAKKIIRCVTPEEFLKHTTAS